MLNLKGSALDVLTRRNNFFWLCALIVSVYSGIYFGAKLNLTQETLISFIGLTVSTVSIGLTFALAVLAVNAFGKHREIEEVQEKILGIDSKIGSKIRSALLVDKLLMIALEKMEKDIARMDDHINEELKLKDKKIEENIIIRDNTINHIRQILLLFMHNDKLDKLNRCRNIIGAIDENSTLDITEITIECLDDLYENMPEERDMIAGLRNEAKKKLRKIVASGRISLQEP